MKQIISISIQSSMRAAGIRVVKIAEEVGVHRATIYQELKRGGEPEKSYRAEVAQRQL